MTITAEELVNREVHYCVSHLVSTLAQAYGIDDHKGRASDLSDAGEQAMELCSAIDDWEEAARDAGWVWNEDAGSFTNDGETWLFDKPEWRELCEAVDIEPYQREVFEHWIVSDWLADKLAEKGEKVDKDFCGLTVWARTTTGQGIANDWVIEQIVADLNKGA